MGSKDERHLGELENWQKNQQVYSLNWGSIK